VSIRIALFGQPRVLSADGSREFPLPRKTLNVLAYLILNYRRPSTRDSIAFALFPDEDEERARNSLRRNLSYLLTALPDGRQFVSADAERLAWNADAPASVDVIAFEEAVRDGRDADALAEYTGLLLPTLYDEWTVADRERLRDVYHEVLVRTIARERSDRRFEMATASAHRLLDDDPWREDVVRQLIAIRYEAGDRAGALATFERFAVRLREEMQAAPMPETIAIRDAVLRDVRLPSSEPRRVTPGVAASDPGLPFVGREAAMQVARACWHSAADGRSGVLFVQGEAGAGKSRFVTELARLVESEGGAVVRGYTAAGGEHRPYEAFVEALQGAPDILDDHMKATLTDDRAARVRLFDAVRRRLSELSRRRVLVLVLEDMHWAGAATIDLLEFIVRRFEHEPILVVATYRSDELPRAHPIRSLRRQLHGRDGVAELALDRLSVTDAASAMRAALPAATEPAAIERAVAWAAGIPLLLNEAMRDLAAGRPSSAPDIAGLVGERFARLSANAETALAFGALLGERFELSAIATVTGWRDDEIVEAIGEGIECGLLRATSRTPSLSFAFRHDLIRVAAVERIPEPDRTRAHGLIARALSAPGDGADARAGEIARHFAAAGEPGRAAESYGRAARYALSVYANDDACEIATTGLALCDAADPAQRRLRYDLVACREESLTRIGALERRRADAKALVSLAQDDEARAGALERLFDAYREDDAMRGEVLDALEALARSSPRASRAFLFCSARDAFTHGEYAKARDAAVRAAQAFDAAGDSRSALLARFSLLGTLKVLAAFSEAEEAIKALRPVMESSDDLAMRAEFHRAASSALSEARRDVAIEDARRSLAFALRIGDRFAEARARQNVAAIVSKQGAYQEAIDEQERALAAYRDVGNEEGVAESILNLAAWRLHCGDFGECGRLLESLGSLDGYIPFTALKIAQLRGLLEARLGKDTAERALLDVRHRAGVLALPLFRARLSRELAGVVASKGRSNDALDYVAEAIAELAPLENPATEAEAYALSARLRASLGDAPGARDHAAKAMSLVAGIQSKGAIAWNAAAARALAGDDEAAMQLAETAVNAAVTEALGMPADLAETFLALPWHQHAVAYVWGRPVPLRWER
jgi:DNA-binding SARP family transcriptional activator/tetratricopeptide (TPR) repeat protein